MNVWVRSRSDERLRPVLAIVMAVFFVLAGAASAVPASGAPATSPGQLYAFGDNYYGQLGNATNTGANTANATPALVTLPGATGPAAQVAAGGNQTLVVTTTGQLYAFGDNFYGQLGNTTNSGANTANSTPALVALPGANGAVSQVAAGGNQTLVVTTTGQLYAFGENFYGQLGTATNAGSNTANPTPALVTLPGATGPAAQVATGADDSLVVTTTGQLYAFGDNLYGQLGTATNAGSNTANPTPALVTLPGATGPVAQVAAGAYHSLALTTTGQLYAFGDNDYGELGFAANSGTNTPNPTATLVGLPGATGPVKEITAGGYHSLALTTTGQLYAFGYNLTGQLGTATNAGTSTPGPTPALVVLPATAGPVAQVTAGWANSMALTTTGQVYAFGSNSFGQLGSSVNRGTGVANENPLAVALPAGTTVDTLSTGPLSQGSLVVVADLAIVIGGASQGQAGTPYREHLHATGGVGPYQWAATGLPPGLSMGATTGIVSGDPSAPGSFPATVTVTDRSGVMVSAPLTVAIKASPGVPFLSALSVLPRLSATEGRMVDGKCAAQTVANSGHRRCELSVALRISFTLSTPARVSFSVAAQLRGHLVSGQCVAATTANEADQDCPLLVPVPGGFTHNAASGASGFLWPDRLGARRLGPGTYQLTGTPSSGQLTGIPRTVTFQLAA
ncbi:MAG: putative Ig domain-containing protein [Acidimicrobiales bacterium]